MDTLTGPSWPIHVGLHTWATEFNHLYLFRIVGSTSLGILSSVIEQGFTQFKSTQLVRIKEVSIPTHTHTLYVTTGNVAMSIPKYSVFCLNL